MIPNLCLLNVALPGYLHMFLYLKTSTGAFIKDMQKKVNTTILELIKKSFNLCFLK